MKEDYGVDILALKEILNRIGLDPESVTIVIPSYAFTSLVREIQSTLDIDVVDLKIPESVRFFRFGGLTLKRDFSAKARQDALKEVKEISLEAASLLSSIEYVEEILSES